MCVKNLHWPRARREAHGRPRHHMIVACTEAWAGCGHPRKLLAFPCTTMGDFLTTEMPPPLRVAIFVNSHLQLHSKFPEGQHHSRSPFRIANGVSARTTARSCHAAVQGDQIDSSCVRVVKNSVTNRSGRCLLSSGLPPPTAST